jgi:hypothetical protein
MFLVVVIKDKEINLSTSIVYDTSKTVDDGKSKDKKKDKK